MERLTGCVRPSRMGRAKKDQVTWQRESEPDSILVSEQKEKQVSALNCCKWQ